IEHPEGLAAEAPAEVLHNGGLQFHYKVCPALGGVAVWPLHGGGGSALRRGEGEDAHPFYAVFPEEIAELFKLSLTFSGEPGDKAGAQHQTGYGRPELFKEDPYILPGAPAVHGFQDAVI